MLDSLYGNLLAGPPNRPQVTEPPEDLDGEPVPQKSPQSGDDMFSEPPPKAASPSPTEASGKEEPAANAAPAATFSTAKLMMPPVRKKAEPNTGKKPMMAGLDIAKLQEEKEALMRRRADAAAAAEKPSATAPPATAAASAPAFVRSGNATAATTEGAATSGTSMTTSLYGSPDEEYDPAKPNDYDEFCRRRMRLKAEEELEKRRQEALARHQKGQAPPEPKEDDFATKMLKKMGWKEGSGLGKDGQGLTTPLVLKKTDSRQGSIVEGQKRDAPPAQPQGQPEAKQAKVTQRPPSCVLLLNNLVGAGEVDDDLEEETAEEAGKYGKVVKCTIKEMKGLPDDQAVRIFLEYDKIESATKALVDMNGRYFGGRIVKARFFDPARFASGDLDKKLDE